ncbi:hypothetical protein J6590_045771 [Homalodisca vitripennis]|nr:hypothetical protein J6590_045771 [Homalodisca vitripennis]
MLGISSISLPLPLYQANKPWISNRAVRTYSHVEVGTSSGIDEYCASFYLFAYCQDLDTKHHTHSGYSRRTKCSGSSKVRLFCLLCFRVPVSCSICLPTVKIWTQNITLTVDKVGEPNVLVLANLTILSASLSCTELCLVLSSCLLARLGHKTSQSQWIQSENQMSLSSSIFMPIVGTWTQESQWLQLGHKTSHSQWIQSENSGAGAMCWHGDIDLESPTFDYYASW